MTALSALQKTPIFLRVRLCKTFHMALTRRNFLTVNLRTPLMKSVHAPVGSVNFLARNPHKVSARSTEVLFQKFAEIYCSNISIFWNQFLGNFRPKINTNIYSKKKSQMSHHFLKKIIVDDRIIDLYRSEILPITKKYHNSHINELYQTMK